MLEQLSTFLTDTAAAAQEQLSTLANQTGEFAHQKMQEMQEMYNSLESEDLSSKGTEIAVAITAGAAIGTAFAYGIYRYSRSTATTNAVSSTKLK